MGTIADAGAAVVVDVVKWADADDSAVGVNGRIARALQCMARPQQDGNMPSTAVIEMPFKVPSTAAAELLHPDHPGGSQA